MKIKPETYADLKEAIGPIMEACAISSGALTESRRWDCLWRLDPWISRLYAEGLDDNHIDTALKRIARELSA